MIPTFLGMWYSNFLYLNPGNNELDWKNSKLFLKLFVSKQFTFFSGLTVLKSEMCKYILKQMFFKQDLFFQAQNNDYTIYIKQGIFLPVNHCLLINVVMFTA